MADNNIYDKPVDDASEQAFPEDNETPFQPAEPSPTPELEADSPGQGQASALDDTHQVTDTTADSHEQYDEGVSGAAEAHEPNPGNAVTGYTPPSEGEDADNKLGEAGS